MLLLEKDQDVFKQWVLPKLEKISDADAEVLADYVIALVVANDSEANIKRNCLDSLADFLQDYTQAFVDDVVQALREKSYLPGAVQQLSHPPPAPIPSIVGTSNYEYEPHSLHASNAPPVGAPKGPAAARPRPGPRHLLAQPAGPSPSRDIQQGASHLSRKRKLIERETSQARDGHDAHYSRTGGGHRAPKQTARRGGRNARGGHSESQRGLSNLAAMFSAPHLPPPPPGPLPFDPTDPAAFFALAAAAGFILPNMPSLPFGPPQGNGLDYEGPREKCKDYFTKGVCKLGSLCPHEHGNEPLTSADGVPEYDPEHASLGLQSGVRVKGAANGHGARRSKSRNNRGGRSRAPFSQPGPSSDRTNTTLVVEQIPEENFSEDDLREYFTQFGPIVDVEMHIYKRLAVLKFEHRSAADQAYNSPKAIFDNRFVKVYWYNPDALPGPAYAGSGDAHMADTDEVEKREDSEEIAKRQAEAQKAFEERRRKVEEAEARAEDIDRQLKEKNEEMKQIRRQLAELGGDPTSDEAFSQALATLQAEAEDLFAQREPEAPLSRGRGAFLGGYRGRGSSAFTSRGRGRAAFRGTHRGRDSAVAFLGRSGVRRLDNRPRRLAIADIEADSSRDEALRQYLINMPDCMSIERHPGQPDSLILTFSERYQAEIFLDESRRIPDIGKLDLSWVPNDAFGGIKSSTEKPDVTVASDDGSSAAIGEQENNDGASAEVEQQGSAVDADMDVADDVDQWL